MKYFAKYLPVEGEIKGEGEAVLLKKPHPQGQLRHVYRKRMSPYWDGKSWDNQCETFAIDEDPKDGAGFVHVHEIKLAKLVLCSRDIKVGDKIVTLATGNYFTLNKMKDIENVEHHYAKVIGEISPDAIWVKEGMEFDEYEVRWNGTGTTLSTWETEGFVQIKCPTCKTFH